MANQNVLQFTDANFDGEVLQSPTPVLVDFWAEWCGPCRMISPVIDFLADNFKGKIKIGKVDTDANEATAKRFGIQSIPTLLIFKNGQLIQRLVGGQPHATLKKALGDTLAVPA